MERRLGQAEDGSKVARPACRRAAIVAAPPRSRSGHCSGPDIVAVRTSAGKVFGGCWLQNAQCVRLERRFLTLVLQRRDLAILHRMKIALPLHEEDALRGGR